MKSNDLTNLIARTKQASVSLLDLSAGQRKAVLLALAGLIAASEKTIITANLRDVESTRREGRTDSFIERLSLDAAKVGSLAHSLQQVANLPDKLFKTIYQRSEPSGIKLKKVIYPLGLVAIIYESRPNVTVDAFALSFKSGNGVILKGGGEIKETNKILVGLIKRALSQAGVDKNVVLDLSRIDRGATLQLVKNKTIDCLIPRGGKGLIAFARENAEIPMIITGASVVHTYVDQSADLALAARVVLNAKTRRVSICNALDVVLLHKDIAGRFLKLAAAALAKKNVTIKADRASFTLLKKLGYQKLERAGQKDFDTEFLDYILAVKIVGGFDQAIAHIQKHSLGHSEAIITRNQKQAGEFFKKIDAACLYLNTSTQFSDGGEFGLGAELGISTQKLHARGPFAYEELTTYKYLVTSRGAIRK